MRAGTSLQRFAMLATLLACAYSAGVLGAGLYSAQVPVNSQADGERAEALKTALAQVVIRVSGDTAALARPEVAKAVSSAERFVQQYQYQQDNSGGASAPARLILVAQFDRDAVDQLLQNLGLAGAAAAPGAPPAVFDNTPKSYRVWVSGVRSAQDYARLIGALSANESTRDVRVEQARGDGMQLQLTVAGPLQRLLDTLNSGAVVRVTNAKPPVEGMDALLDMQPQ